MREHIACRRTVEPQAAPRARQHGDRARIRRHRPLERAARALLERYHPVLIGRDPVETDGSAHRHLAIRLRECRAGDATGRAVRAAPPAPPKTPSCITCQPRISVTRSARAPSAPSRPPKARRPASGERLSNMQPLPGRIDEHRLHDSRPHGLALQRIGADDLLADVLEAAVDKVRARCTCPEPSTMLPR